jgi:hypothetical protein
VHDAPAAKLAGQLVVGAVNCNGLLPLLVAALSASTALVLVLVTVTDCTALVVPVCWFPKDSEVGDTE